MPHLRPEYDLRRVRRRPLRGPRERSVERGIDRITVQGSSGDPEWLMEMVKAGGHPPPRSRLSPEMWEMVDRLFPPAPKLHRVNPPLVVDGSSQAVIDQTKIAWSAAMHTVKGRRAPSGEYQVDKQSTLKSMELLKDHQVSPWIWCAWRLRWLVNEGSQHDKFRDVIATRTVGRLVKMCKEVADDCRDSLVISNSTQRCMELRDNAVLTIRMCDFFSASEAETLLKREVRLYSQALTRVHREHEEFKLREKQRLENGYWVWSRTP